MKFPRSIFKLLAVCAVCLLAGGKVWAQTTSPQMLYHVTIDTSQLEAHQAAPFSLQFTLLDGAGTGDGNATIILTNFNFGTNGNYSGDPDTDGGVTGDLSTNVTMTDTSGENDFSENFDPGNTLTFDLYATLSLDTNAVSDELDFSILDSEGEPIPTLDTNEANVMIRLTTPDGANINVESYSTDASQNLVASGPPVSFGAQVLLNGTLPPGRPLIAIADNGDGSATLSWPALYTSFNLESSPDLTNWDLLPVELLLVNTNSTGIVYYGDATNQFYRLVQ